MVNYVSLARTAERLIEANGRTFTLVRVGETAVDPAKPYGPDTSAGESRHTVLGVIVDFDNEDIDGQVIRRGDKQCLIAHNSIVDVASGSESIVIEEFDSLEDGTEVWKIAGVKTVNTGYTRIMYDLQLRK